MKTYTIGFTQKSAERFFSLLRGSDIDRLIDVRLNNVSQLAGFAKKKDLIFFLRELCDVDYVHLPETAPTKDILDAYKKKKISWRDYEEQYYDLIIKRNVERSIDKSVIDKGCLLCSEHKPHQCHRRLLVEYLNRCWDSEIEVVHLV